MRVFPIFFIVATIFGASLAIHADCGRDLVDESTWGGRLLNSYQPFDFATHPLKFGVEIEGTVSSNIGRDGVSKIIAASIRQFDPSVEVYDRTVLVEYKKNGVSHIYRVATDYSILPRGYRDAVELISPILETQWDFALFYHVVKDLKSRAGMRPNARSGLHVHVDFPNPRVGELTFLGSLFAGIEAFLFERFSIISDRREFAKNMPSLFSNLKDLDLMPNTVEGLLNLNTDRQHALNFRALKEHGTVELRLFNSTLSEAQIKLMIDFSRKLIQAVRSKDPRLLQALSSVKEGELLSPEAIAQALEFDFLNAPKVLWEIHREARKSALAYHYPGVGILMYALGLSVVLERFDQIMSRLKFSGHLSNLRLIE